MYVAVFRGFRKHAAFVVPLDRGGVHSVGVCAGVTVDIAVSRFGCAARTVVRSAGPRVSPYDS